MYKSVSLSFAERNHTE